MKGKDILTRIVSEKQKSIECSMRKISEPEIKKLAYNSENECRGFRKNLDSLNCDRINIIAEIKRASPSLGLIRKDIDPAGFARNYEKGGASAISVLTEEQFFLGCPDDLKSVRDAVSLPVLRKDFIISEYQLYESKYIGADAVLLIVRLLSSAMLRKFLDISRDLEIDALVEIHNEEELYRATMSGANLIGLNNRDLSTFVTDINVSVRLAGLIGEGIIPVSESGIKTECHIKAIKNAGIRNFLIGESIVGAYDPSVFIRNLCVFNNV